MVLLPLLPSPKYKAVTESKSSDQSLEHDPAPTLVHQANVPLKPCLSKLIFPKVTVSRLLECTHFRPCWSSKVSVLVPGWCTTNSRMTLQPRRMRGSGVLRGGGESPAASEQPKHPWPYRSETLESLESGLADDTIGTSLRDRKENFILVW